MEVSLNQSIEDFKVDKRDSLDDETNRHQIPLSQSINDFKVDKRDSLDGETNRRNSSGLQMELSQSINEFKVDQRDSLDDETNRRNTCRRHWMFKMREEEDEEEEEEGRGEEGQVEDRRAKAKAILEKQTSDKTVFKQCCRWICYRPESKEYRVAFQEQKTGDWLEKQSFIDSTSLRPMEDGKKALDQIRKTFPWLLYTADTRVDTLKKSLIISKSRANLLTEEDQQHLVKESEKLQELNRIISKREQLVTEREKFVAHREQFLLSHVESSSREADIFSQFRTDLTNGKDVDEILAKIVAKEQEDPQLMVVFTKFYPLLERLALKNKSILGKRHAPQLEDETIIKQVHGSQEIGSQQRKVFDINIDDEKLVKGQEGEDLQGVRKAVPKGEKKSSKKIHASRKASEEIEIYVDEQQEGDKQGVQEVVQKGKTKRQILEKQMYKECGHAHRKDVTAFISYRETEGWKREYKALCDFLKMDDATQKELNILIEEMHYDPVYYILTMKFGWRSINQVKASAYKKKGNLNKLYEICGKYYEFYAQSINAKRTRY